VEVSQLRKSLATMRSERYFRVLDALETLVAAEPPPPPSGAEHLAKVTIKDGYTRVRKHAKKHNAAVLGSCQGGNYLTPPRLRDRRTGSRLLGTTVSSLPCATTPPWSPTRACSSRLIVSPCAPRSASRGIHRSGSRGEDRTDAVMTSSTSRRSFLLCPCASSSTRPLTVQGAVHFDRDADLAPNRRGAHPQQCVEVG
jgi:hypothetical protein